MMRTLLNWSKRRVFRSRRVLVLALILLLPVVLIYMYYTVNGEHLRISCDVSETKNNCLRHLIQTVTQALEKHHVTHWLDYGSLLGSYRYCDVIPWDLDADIGYLETDYSKVLKAASEVRKKKGFEINSLIASYENMTLDLFRWRKVRKWSFTALYHLVSGHSNISEDFQMEVVMPMDNSVVVYFRNIVIDAFPASFLSSMTQVPIADFTVTSVGNVKEFLQWRYFLTFDQELPYNMACLQEYRHITNRNTCGANKQHSPQTS